MPFSECIFCGKKEYWANEAPKEWVCEECEARHAAQEQADEERAENETNELWHDM